MADMVIANQVMTNLQANFISHMDNISSKLKNLEDRINNIFSQMEVITKKMDDQLVALQRIEGKIESQSKHESGDNKNTGVLNTWASDFTANLDAFNNAQGWEKVLGALTTAEASFNKFQGIIAFATAIASGVTVFRKLLGRTENSEGSTSGDGVRGIWDKLKELGGRFKDGTKQIGGRAWDVTKSVGGKAIDGIKWAGNKTTGGVQTGWKMTTEFGGKAVGSMMDYSKNLLQVAKSVNLLSGAQKALNLVMRMSPIGAIILAVGLLIENWDKVKAVLDSVWAKFQETFPGLAKIVETYVGYIIAFWTQLPDNIMAALGSVYEIITGAFSSAFDWLSQKFSWIQGAWNSLFGGGNKAGEAPGDVQSNARGGIIMHPILTTFAEEGPEAAIPLDGSSRAVSLWYTAGRMLGMFEGQQQPSLGAALPAFGGDSNNQGIVVSAPINITINGNADSNTVQQVQQAAQAALMDLKRQLKELQWQERRVSFG
jgi:hypothetical protein